jgi:hypothetical protein
VRLLTSELQALRDATDTSATAYQAPDAVQPYLELLGVWPADLPTRVDRLEVGVSALRLTLSVRDHTDANRLVGALTEAGLPWTLGSRNIRQSPRADGGVRVDVILNRAERSEGAP